MYDNNVFLLDENKKTLRNELLKKVYEGKEFNSLLLRALDLEVYDNKTKSLLFNLNKAIRRSNLDPNITLSEEQIDCLNLLNQGHLFISAPTSFGKTYIALEYIKCNMDKLNTIVFVVPTIALMNELRKKCFIYFGEVYNIITSEAELELNQYNAKKLMILVPERVNSFKIREFLKNDTIDFSVYDEIYKLNYDPIKKDNDNRLIVMNYTYKYLIENSRRILLLGPFIKNVNFEKSKLKINKYVTNLNLVYNQIYHIDHENVNLRFYEGKEFIYFLSPTEINKFISKQDINDLPDIEYDQEIINWMCEHVHPNWNYIELLKKGIGIHHGNTPIFLRKYIENEYCNGIIHTILCTSTLIEGINTPTDKLIIYDCPKTTFELNNLIGRVGRLNVSSPKKGEIYFTNSKIDSMYNPDDWIELNILYEQEGVLSNQKEDEYLYLEKTDESGKVDYVETFLKNLKEEYKIDKAEILKLGIEFKILKNFINSINELKNAKNQFEVINILKKKIILENMTYLNGLKSNKYSFYNNATDKAYLKIDPVYYLLVSDNDKKSVIQIFLRQYPNASNADINLFIDVIFKAEEYIKFKLTKIVPIFELFSLKNILSNQNFALVEQCINRISAFNSSNNSYERILYDIGFPEEDVIELLNYFESNVSDISLENKLGNLKNEKIYLALSPFGKKLVDSYHKT